MLIIPTWNLFNILFYIILAVTIVVVAYFDYHGLWTLQYSKFSKGTGVSARMAMIILYVLPIIVATAAAWSYLRNASIIQLVVYGVVTLHFAKRVLESLFLHKYSGTMAIPTLIFITFFYSFVAGMISYLNAQSISTMDAWFYLGMTIFLVGESGNFYHHKLLADLRKNREGYHIPQGGFFEHAACPHYFFELVSWLGILFLSRHLFAFMALIAFTAYLTERSIKTRQWYQENFPEYPLERKCIVPFVF